MLSDFSKYGWSYFIKLGDVNDDLLDFICNLLAVNGCEVTYAGDDRFENLVLGCFPEALLDVFPEIVHQSTVVRDEIGQRRHQVEAVALHIVQFCVVLDH